MKKSIKIKVKEKTIKAHVREIEIFVCDICKFESKDKTLFRYCGICKRLVCHKLSESCARVADDCGDYPDYYCKKCYELRYKKYEEEFRQREENRDKEDELFIEKIKKESLLL